METPNPLKAFRERQTPPLSQGQLAEKLGVSRVSVTRWEAKRRKINKDLLPRVASVTGLSPAELRPDLAVLMEGAPE